MIAEALTTDLAALLPTATWTLENFLGNADSAVRTLGGLFLVLLGAVAVIWGGTLLIKKLMSSEQDRTSWAKIILLLLIGGAFAFGGTSLIFDVAGSSETTIRDIGEGFILLG